jgi:uncharacterized membrane protein (UPF0127 family)
MKDMYYPIDMVWLSASGTITYIAVEAKPETYPATFTPPVPSRYVIETVPGLFAARGLKVGDVLDMAPIIENNR